ncbi:F-box protein CPR1-like [Castanea sativa]|uniref:F-box protein CPR1-like n=1 Tax=Castanea sativa TaxID=21020 RepID=UPI003F652845
MRTFETQHDMCACIKGIICIICLGDLVAGGFVLWNPAIKQFKVVPCPTLPDSPINIPSKAFPSFAIGYDHNSNDYKVVRIVTYRRSTDISNVDKYSFVHVYTLSTDSWRQIKTAIDHSNIYFYHRFNEIYLNGVHHCSVTSRVDKVMNVR